MTGFEGFHLSSKAAYRWDLKTSVYTVALIGRGEGGEVFAVTNHPDFISKLFPIAL